MDFLRDKLHGMAKALDRGCVQYLETPAERTPFQISLKKGNGLPQGQTARHGEGFGPWMCAVPRNACGENSIPNKSQKRQWTSSGTNCTAWRRLWTVDVCSTS